MNYWKQCYSTVYICIFVQSHKQILFMWLDNLINNKMLHADKLFTFGGAHQIQTETWNGNVNSDVIKKSGPFSQNWPSSPDILMKWPWIFFYHISDIAIASSQSIVANYCWVNWCIYLYRCLLYTMFWTLLEQGMPSWEVWWWASPRMGCQAQRRASGEVYVMFGVSLCIAKLAPPVLSVKPVCGCMHMV